jgi:hypothetical protein
MDEVVTHTDRTINGVENFSCSWRPTFYSRNLILLAIDHYNLGERPANARILALFDVITYVDRRSDRC